MSRIVSPPYRSLWRLWLALACIAAACVVPGCASAGGFAKGAYAPEYEPLRAELCDQVGQVLEAAKASGSYTPLGAHATELYTRFCDDGNADIDFSGIFRSIRKSGG